MCVGSAQHGGRMQERHRACMPRWPLCTALCPASPQVDILGNTQLHPRERHKPIYATDATDL